MWKVESYPESCGTHIDQWSKLKNLNSVNKVEKLTRYLITLPKSNQKGLICRLGKSCVHLSQSDLKSLTATYDTVREASEYAYLQHQR